MKQSVVILLHSGYWLLYSALFTLLFALFRAREPAPLQDWDDWLVILAVALLTGLLSFYGFYGWLVPRYLTTRRVGRFLGGGLVLSLLIALLTTLVLAALTAWLVAIVLHQRQLVFFPLQDQLLFVAVFTVLALVNGALGTLLRGFSTWYTEIHVKEALASKTLRAQLALLQAQLNPHFLFNTLNNIDILIERDAARASLYLNKLSDLLRFVLYDTQADRIPLTQELAYLQQYIALQQLRTTNDHYVKLQIDGSADGVLIAPMLFVPYLENAFKYATNKKVKEAIHIQITIGEGALRFQCSNRIDRAKAAPQQHSGLGNELLRQRLALLYAEKFTLAIQATDKTYTVELIVPLRSYDLSAR